VGCCNEEVMRRTSIGPCLNLGNALAAQHRSGAVT